MCRSIQPDSAETKSLLLFLRLDPGLPGFAQFLLSLVFKIGFANTKSRLRRLWPKEKPRYNQEQKSERDLGSEKEFLNFLCLHPCSIPGSLRARKGDPEISRS